MRNFILSLLLALTFSVGTAQKGYLGLGITYNYYSLEDLKNFQNKILNQLPVSGKITYNFPSHVGFKGYYSNEFYNQKILFFAGFNSTGGSVSYSDYSGRILINQILDIYSFGGQIEFPLYEKNNFSLSLAPKGLIALTTLKFKQLVEIYPGIQEEKYKLNSSTLGLGFGFIASKEIRFIKFIVEAGYDYFLPSDIYLHSDKNLFLVNSNNEKVKCELSGFRTSLGVSLNLSSLLKTL